MQRHHDRVLLYVETDNLEAFLEFALHLLPKQSFLLFFRNSVKLLRKFRYVVVVEIIHLSRERVKDGLVKLQLVCHVDQIVEVLDVPDIRVAVKTDMRVRQCSLHNGHVGGGNGIRAL